MAILYGTTGEGETLPVLVDQFGNLLAKGIEGQPGQPGQPGAPGQPGPPGGDFPLPPDPYEGAFLGWLNNDLAWIGTPPVPIPEGRFGPITSWDPAGLLTVAGEIPPQVAQGVFVYQCNEDGSIYVEDWDNTFVWSSYITSDNGNFQAGNPPANAFDGFKNTLCGAETIGANSRLTWTPLLSTFTSFASVTLIGPGAGVSVTITDGSGVSSEMSITASNTYTATVTGIRNIVVQSLGPSFQADIRQIDINEAELVDTGEYPAAPNLNFRVQSVSGQNLIGTANRTENFSIGKYLRVPEQNVARWLYDGNLNKVITSTGIDISRLKGT